MVKEYIREHFFKRPAVIEKNSSEAYDLWSENYDFQPGNLMLDLDEALFPRLLEKTIISGKTIADIGCGTGRHWNKMLEKSPLSLTGFDVSAGMLNKLKEKFPCANTHLTTDNTFASVESASVDIIVSTLTVAHIDDIEQALQAWSRILKPKGEIIITDFHPKLLAFGGKRTFNHHSKMMAVKNYVHQLAEVKDIMQRDGLKIITQEEVIIDENVKHYYTNQDALPVYERFKGFPVIYGIYLSR